MGDSKGGVPDTKSLLLPENRKSESGRIWDAIVGNMVNGNYVHESQI